MLVAEVVRRDVHIADAADTIGKARREDSGRDEGATLVIRNGNKKWLIIVHPAAQQHHQRRRGGAVGDLLIGDLFDDRVANVWAPLESLYAPATQPIP